MTAGRVWPRRLCTQCRTAFAEYGARRCRGCAGANLYTEDDTTGYTAALERDDWEHNAELWG